MRMSTRARYGLRLMVELGLRYSEGPVFLREIAKVEEISEKYLSQIIIPLKAARLVTSFRGAHGGYILARPPAQITLKDIIETLEGDFDLVECVKNPETCTRVSICVTRSLWQDLGKKMAETLDSKTLDDLVRQCKDKQNCAMYSI
ncbi:MAG: Rrf2 family transcriptional regulator [PVC group bacterium]|nr:Rrf2 family transcriptional regulator [PVC group bacterium]